jgi:hypothetical protein
MSAVIVAGEEGGAELWARGWRTVGLGVVPAQRGDWAKRGRAEMS